MTERTEILSTAEMRMSEAAAMRSGIPSLELMRRAGEGIFRSTEWNGPAAVVCGTGNNAGDGYVVAAMLQDTGIPCDLILVEDRFSDDGRYYFNRCVKKGIPVKMFSEVRDLREYTSILDCIFGTGFRGEAEGLFRSAIEAINESGAFVVSADINSGINGDTGEGTVFVRSDITVSVGFRKTGHVSGKGPESYKKLINADIGISPIHL